MRLNSIRWKLLSTYLTLIFLILLIVNIFLYTTFLNSSINDHSQLINVQANIISNQADSFINTINENQFSNEYLQSLITKYSMNINSRILILNESGQVLLDTTGKDINKSLRHIPEVREALNKRDTTKIYRHKNERMSYTATPIIVDDAVEGVVFVVSKIGHLYAETSRQMNGILIFSVIALIITVIVSILFANVISLPISTLNDKVKNISGAIDFSHINDETTDEIKQLNASFDLLSTKLKQIENRRKKFVSNVSHELRTPITSMKILSETIMSGESWDESLYREFMADINSELTRLSLIIEDLLYLVDVEKDEVTFKYELTSLNFMIRDVLGTLNPIALNKNLNLIFDETTKVQTYVDRSKFYRVLVNLIGNSIKYTEEGYVRIKLYTTFDEITIEIQDTGVGIAEKDLPYIFDRFYRVDESRASKKGSTGLGLSISQEIIALHNGKISIESQMNVGTTVRITLPNKEL